MTADALAASGVVLDYGDAVGEYTAARRGTVAVWRNHVGRVRAVGRDRLDLLHRMSTNDLTGMAVGEARTTVLTSAIARMVDVLWVLNRAETALYLTGAGRAPVVRRWLGGYVFYNDQVKFADATAELGQFGLFGPRAPAVAEALAPGAADLPENRFLDNGEVVVARARPLAGAGYAVIAPAAQINRLWQQALAGGAVPAGEQAYQWLRVAAGQPEGAADGTPLAGRELTEEYIPLEANLWPAVSFKKGCYIGQEIIARMESRGKLARRLVGLKLDAPVDVGAEITASGAAVGAVTSAAVPPDVGPVALAYLKSAAAEPGQAVGVGGVAGMVVDLPILA
ncbi:MAG: folate-binding protein YgfZ [Anaerolineales bacterium]|nr:folate-binding protein YgfZ [Anaerolineales bacterium]